MVSSSDGFVRRVSGPCSRRLQPIFWATAKADDLAPPVGPSPTCRDSPVPPVDVLKGFPSSAPRRRLPAPRPGSKVAPAVPPP